MKEWLCWKSVDRARPVPRRGEGWGGANTHIFAKNADRRHSTRVLGQTPRHFAGGVGVAGVLRLRNCFASRSSRCAQDDKL